MFLPFKITSSETQKVEPDHLCNSLTWLTYMGCIGTTGERTVKHHHGQ